MTRNALFLLTPYFFLSLFSSRSLLSLLHFSLFFFAFFPVLPSHLSETQRARPANANHFAHFVCENFSYCVVVIDDVTNHEFSSLLQYLHGLVVAYCMSRLCQYFLD